MSEKNFKVGQVWRDRNGDLNDIIDIAPGTYYPVKARQRGFFSSCRFTLEGNFNSNRLVSEYDLIELVSSVKSKKTRMTLRLDEDIVAHFRKGGKGYSTRINEALHKFINELEDL